MFVIRAPKNSEYPFTQISNSLISDNRLSFKSKGLLLFLLSKPNSWVFNFHDILRSNNVGIKSIRSSIRQLISFGYLLPSQPRNSNGTFSYFNYTLFETPTKLSTTKTTSQPHSPFRHAVKPLADKPLAVSCTTANNKIVLKIFKEKTTTSTKVVNNTTVVASPEYIKKKKEFIAYSKSLGVFNQESLIKKYGLDILLKNVYSFAGSIKKSKNPTGCLVTSIIENWISKPGPADFPILLVFDSYCETCGKWFSYLSYKPNQTICPKCK